MAGHSHSSNIKFRKDRVDAKRAKAFAKLARMITVAARQGGGSIEGNAKLRLCAEKARVLSMPKDVIERAIRKGTGEGELGNYEEFVYEGYGPGGIALMLEILTDNRHRTAADVRMLFEKFGGNLGATGAVAWMFERKGRFLVDPAAGGAGAPGGERKLGEDRLLEIVLEVGADDLQAEGDAFAIYCRLAAFADVNQALAARGVPLREAGLAYVPSQRVTVADEAVATRLVRLIDALEDNDDVQGVFSNEDFPEAVVRALEA
ncbi:MAG TPA: YebC/PmpR family DNA-binding transcriptional regulator [Planctomycetota bacterium]|nr:YebC/PmpR family DNA-binding transcriptional regulator [Planctomycetota bacterium]